MVLKDHELSGEERKIVSTRLYASEFLFFKKLCDQEGKSVNTKLREMIKGEIKKDPKKFSKTMLEKEKEGIERANDTLLLEEKPYGVEIKMRVIKNAK